MAKSNNLSTRRQHFRRQNLQKSSSTKLDGYVEKEELNAERHNAQNEGGGLPDQFQCVELFGGGE